MYLLILLSCLMSSAFAQSTFNIEAGMVSNPYNQVKITGDKGSKINFASSFDESKFYHRLQFIHKFKSKHGMRLLYAPLRLTGDKTPSSDLNFQGVGFKGATKLYTEYQFNSYRASYFYQLLEDDNFFLRVGVTAKVRDAKVKLSQGSRTKFKKNSGVVPLLYLYSQYKWDNGLRVVFDFDGWTAPQGRAFDMALMGGYVFSPNLGVNLGYRYLEGGADNKKVYNFSQLSYYFASLDISF